MERSVISVATICALTTALAACHPPTLQSEYADARRCHAALEAGLKIYTIPQLRLAGLLPGQLTQASASNLEHALNMGKRFGMTSAAIFEDLEVARSSYLEIPSTEGLTQAKMGKEMTSDFDRCIDRYLGRDNE